MQKFESIESKMPKYKNEKEKRRVARHIKLLALVVMMSSLGKLIYNLKKKLPKNV